VIGHSSCKHLINRQTDGYTREKIDGKSKGKKANKIRMTKTCRIVVRVASGKYDKSPFTTGSVVG
jgi:hypothetical protein